MEKVVAVFDLEGTLFKRSSNFMREIRNSRKRGVMGKVKVATFDISLMMIVICYKMLLVGELEMRTAIIKRFAALLKGTAEREIAQRARVFAAKYMDLLRPEISGVLQAQEKMDAICTTPGTTGFNINPLSCLLH